MHKLSSAQKLLSQDNNLYTQIIILSGQDNNLRTHYLDLDLVGSSEQIAHKLRYIHIYIRDLGGSVSPHWENVILLWK